MRKPASFVSITVFSISGNLFLRSDIGRIVYSGIEMLAAADSNHHKQKDHVTFIYLANDPVFFIETVYFICERKPLQ